MEQRKYSRTRLNLNAFMRVDDQSIHCLVENISAGGAYIKTFMRDEETVASMPVGKQLNFYC